jgi:hypothetical protein
MFMLSSLQLQTGKMPCHVSLACLRLARTPTACQWKAPKSSLTYTVRREGEQAWCANS